MRKREFLPFLLLVFLFLIGIYILSPKIKSGLKVISPEELAEKYQTAPTPTPTPRPLTFAEMNALYGPCVRLPTLMYHHIQDREAANAKNQTALSVETETFKKQMEYLKAKGYRTAGMEELIAFFDEGTPVSAKSVLLTFDDGYHDFVTTALPILSEVGFKATLFISTGLIDNPGYLAWDDIESASASGNLFANHTWSHKNLQTSKEKVEFEIQTADSQLAERGLNSPKVFAYPYGLASDYAGEYLTELGYKLAFTTRPGSVLCKKQRSELPRLRIGNTSLGAYGL
ncbi:MAG: polysaccharide deacetylase family protein [Patescibacteria group bacterium]